MVRRIASVLLSFALAAFLPCWAEKPGVPCGFDGSASAQAYSAFLDTLFIGETSGYLGAWNPKEKAFSARRRVGRDPIVLMACHPEKGEICVVESDALSRNIARILSVADGSFEEIKVLSLPERPDFLGYSPKGGLLAFAARTARGILLLETGRYEEIEGFPSDCGPTTFLAIGSSEKSLLQYAPQGRIIYRQVPQGSVIQEAKILANLDCLALSSDKKSLFASSQGNFVSIDSMSGKTNFSLPMKGLAAFTPPDGEGKTLLCFLDGRRQTLDIDDRKAPSLFESSPQPFISAVSLGSGYSAIDKGGNVHISSGGDAFQAIAPEPFFQPSVLSFFEDGNGPGFILGGPDGSFFVLERELAEDAASADLFGPAAIPRIKGPSALGSIGTTIFFSDQSGKAPEILRMDGLSNAPSRINLEGNSPVARISLSEYGILAIQANGVVSSLGTGSPKRLASISGVQDAVAISPAKIAIGKVRGGGLQSPLLYYSLATGELSPFSLEAITVFRLRLSVSERLYAICIEEEEGNVRTAIREVLDGVPSTSLLASAPGENFGTQLAFDEEGNAYFSFGDRHSVTKVGPNDEAIELELADYPEKIAVGKTAVCVLHADGSFSAIDLGAATRSRFAIDGKGALLRID